MKRVILVLVLALAAGGGGFGLIAWRHAVAERGVDGSHGSDLAWLRHEFALDDAQFAAIAALHEAYRPICAGHCKAIAEAAARADTLRRAAAPAPEVAQAGQALADLEEACNTATRDHLRRVAALMAPAQGRRFLDRVEPHLAQQPHDPARRGVSRR
jgi:hypothetical protein